MSYEDNVKALQEAAKMYWDAARKLERDFQTDVVETQDSNVLKRIGHTVDAASHAVKKVIDLIDTESMTGRKLQSRVYVVRRASRQAGLPLTWEELDGASGPWSATVHGQEYAHRHAARGNEREEKDSLPYHRGHRKGAYVHQVWVYTPETESWAKMDCPSK